MLDGTYTLKIDTTFGKKDGAVTLSTEGSTVNADIDVPIVGKRHVTGTADGDSFSAEGSTKILLLGKIDYTINGKVEGDSLSMQLHTSKGDFDLEGTRV